MHTFCYTRETLCIVSEDFSSLAPRFFDTFLSHCKNEKILCDIQRRRKILFLSFMWDIFGSTHKKRKIISLAISISYAECLISQLRLLLFISSSWCDLLVWIMTSREEKVNSLYLNVRSCVTIYFIRWIVCRHEILQFTQLLRVEWQGKLFNFLSSSLWRCLLLYFHQTVCMWILETWKYLWRTFWIVWNVFLQTMNAKIFKRKLNCVTETFLN